MTCIELFQILSKPWATTSDIQNIVGCGKDKATDIRDSITKNIISKGKFLPITKPKVVPMTYVIDYLGLDLNHISYMAQQEKKLC